MTRAHADPHPRTRLPLAIGGAMVWLSALVLYAATAGPGIVELFDDSLEFQLVGPAFGIAHPTGYPLYTILGGLWSRVLFPLGNWAWRMNLFSTIAAATAVLFVYLTGARLLPQVNGRQDIWAGLAAAAGFALGPVWWSQATIAEVYALHGLLLAAILYTALSIPPLLDGGRTTHLASRRTALLALLVGLALAHHRMTVLLLPALFVYLLWSAPSLWRPQKQWLSWLGALLLPLALYLWLPLRAGQGVSDLNGSYVNTLAGFLDHVLARGYTGFFASNALGEPHTLSDAALLIWQQLGVAAVALATIGLALMPLQGDRTRKTWMLLFLVLAANCVFALRYRVPDWQVFLIPVFLVLALFTGAGVAIVVQWLARSPIDRPRLASVAGALAVLLILALPIGDRERINRSEDWDAHQYAFLLGTVDYPPQSRVIGLEGEMTALQYMQVAERMAANAHPVTADPPAERADAIAASVQAGYPTYITRELPGIENRYSFSGEGSVVRAWPRGQAGEYLPTNALDMELLDGMLRLEGYDVRTVAAPGGPVLEISLGWLPVRPLNRALKVSIRLQDTDGNPVLDAAGEPVVADRFPLRQVALSPAWLPGEQIRDIHHISLQGVAQPANILVIAYDAETLEEFGRVVLPVP